MLPKSSKHFIQPTAEELGYSATLVDDAVSFFYSELRKTLVDMKHFNVQVPNLGSFKAIPNELPKLIHKYEKHLGVLQPETFNQMALKKDLETRLEKVRKLKEMMDEEWERKQEFLKEKNARLQKNMEQP